MANIATHRSIGVIQGYRHAFLDTVEAERIPSMGYTFTYLGASGERYTFALTDIWERELLSRRGGIFVLSNYAPEPLFFGNAEKLYVDVPQCEHWSSVSLEGITHFHFLIEPDAARRKAILGDLVERYHPPLNH